VLVYVARDRAASARSVVLVTQGDQAAKKEDDDSEEVALESDASRGRFIIRASPSIASRLRSRLIAVERRFLARCALETR